jgi:lipoprotein NlpI
MSTDPVQRPAPPVGAIIMLVVAGFFYLGMMSSLSDIHNAHVDAAGRGLAEAFGALFAIALWVALAILLLIGGVKGEMPAWSAIAATILLPISGFAAMITVGLLDRGASPRYLLVPASIPPVVAAYALWARVSSLHRVLPPLPTSIVAWAAVALLTAAPLPRYAANKAAENALIQRQKQEAAAAVAKAEEQHRQNLERFQKLTADSPLWDWAEFFGKNSDFDEQAIAGARALAHRQADAEEALRRGMGFSLIEYRRLDLAATPGFCTAAGDFLAQDAATHKAPGADADYLTVQQYFEPYDEAIEWLTQNHCDLDGAVARIRETVAGYKQSSSRDAYLAALAWRRGNGFFRGSDNNRALENYSEAIRLEPDNAQFYKTRADVYYDNDDYNRAIADYGAAIRLADGYTDALNGRGLSYYLSDDDSRALRDFNEAIRLDPEFALAINNRGNVYIREGNLDKAIDDYAAAVRLAPRSRVALANRGRARFYRAAYKLAADDLAAALAMKPRDPYLALWTYLARARAGEDAVAALTGDAAQFDHGNWPWPLVAVYLGQGDANSVLADIRRDANPGRTSQECEADFYLGAKAAVDGQAAGARDLLQQARSTCPFDYIEGDAARYELARLP